MSIIEKVRVSFQRELKIPSVKQIAGESLFLGIFVCLLLIVFQPFGTSEDQMDDKVLKLGGYGIIVFVLFYLGKYLIYKAFKTSNISLKQELAVLSVTFLIVLMATFIYHQLIIDVAFAIRNFPVFGLFGVAIGIIPFGILIYHKIITNKVIIKDSAITGDDSKITIVLFGTNNNEVFKFVEKDILYLQSSANYVEVVFLHKQNLEKVLIRNTLKNIEKQLQSKNFQRIHRSIVVNINHFYKIRNKEGKKYLELPDRNLSLTVSKSYLSSLELKLKDFS
jgi:hypothetical protein